MGVIREVKLRLDGLFRIRKRLRFASRTTAVTTNEIQCDGPDCRIKQGAIVDVVIAPPKANERFLDDVLRVGPRPHPLPRKKQQTGTKLRKTNFPIFVGGDIIHDLFTVFIVKTPPTADFV